MAVFTSGVNELTSTLYNGKTVAEAIEGLSSVLVIPANPSVFINGDAKSVDTIIAAEDNVEFVRTAGVKG